MTETTAAAVVMRGDVVLWSVSAPSAREHLEEQLSALIAQIPQRGWRSSRIFVALGTPYARAKIVRGLPPTGDAKTLAKLIAVAPERFFIASSGELRTTGVRIEEPGAAFVVALDSDVVALIQHVVEEAGYRLAAVTALDVALDPETPRELPVASAAAIGVAAIGAHEPVAYRPIRRDAAQRRRRLWQGAGTAVMISLVAWSVVPGLMAWRTVRRSRAIITTLARHRGDALQTKRELDVVATALGTVSDFEQGRMSKTLLLAQLTDALPTGSALTTLKIDSTGGMVIGMAPHAADIVKALESIPGLSNIAILGPVSHDANPSVSLDRVTVRFQGTPHETHARHSLPAGDGGPRS